MILLDTNVVIYARDPNSPFHQWAKNVISDCVGHGGAALNPISLAELEVGASVPELVVAEAQNWGIQIVDLPAEASEKCAAAYRHYRERRQRNAGKAAPDVPLPDFFIGAHAAIMGWDIATADHGRFKTYFPEVTLHLPEA